MLEQEHVEKFLATARRFFGLWLAGGADER